MGGVFSEDSIGHFSDSAFLKGPFTKFKYGPNIEIVERNNTCSMETDAGCHHESFNGAVLKLNKQGMQGVSLIDKQKVVASGFGHNGKGSEFNSSGQKAAKYLDDGVIRVVSCRQPGREIDSSNRGHKGTEMETVDSRKVHDDGKNYGVGCVSCSALSSRLGRVSTDSSGHTRVGCSVQREEMNNRTMENTDRKTIKKLKYRRLSD